MLDSIPILSVSFGLIDGVAKCALSRVFKDSRLGGSVLDHHPNAPKLIPQCVEGACQIWRHRRDPTWDSIDGTAFPREVNGPH